MKRPLIGITPLVDEERESYWMLPGYMKGIAQAGGIPVMLPLTAERETLRRLAETFDGFLFAGGHDVSPEVYGEEKQEVCGACCPERDEMERVLLAEVLELDKPVFGICRGIQFLNAVLGGTLYQDLPTGHPSEVEHHQTPPYHVPEHSVTLCPDTPLLKLMRKEKLFVNSYHHQAIRELSPRLEAMAYSSDRLVEAVRMPDKKYVWAVQWHPEFSFETDEDSRKLFGSFMEACGKKIEKQ